MTSRSELVGILFVILSATMITVSDAFGKEMSALLPIAVIAWMRYAAATVIMAPAAVALRGWRILPTRRLGLHAARTMCLVFGIYFYLNALSQVTFVSAISAFMIYPILGAGLGVLVLGERMTERKLGALLAGVVGALIVLRPVGGFEPGVLYAFGAGVSVSVFLILSRMLSTSEDPVRLLMLQYVLGAVMLAPLAIYWWETPPLALAPAIFAMALASVVAHTAMYLGLARADTTTLAPFFYFELVAAAVIGLAWFGEWPDALSWLGAAVIACAGLILALAPASEAADAAEAPPTRLGAAAPGEGGGEEEEGYGAGQGEERVSDEPLRAGLDPPRSAPEL
ncbi:MAG: DMT family transporter [Pseudomonadota bacterium]